MDFFQRQAKQKILSVFVAWSYTLNWFVTQEKSTFPAIKYNSRNILKMSKNNVNKDDRRNDTKPKSTAT